MSRLTHRDGVSTNPNQERPTAPLNPFELHAPTAADVWTGRSDPDPDGLSRRYHHHVRIVDPRDIGGAIRPSRPPITLLGFRSDIGVQRNQGRAGAAEGPFDIRRRLTNLALPPDMPDLLDAGDIVPLPEPTVENLERGQAAFAATVAHLYANGAFPILLGGGHEIAKPHVLGAFQAFPDARIGVINLDAHFDLRDLSNGPTSGTPFREIATLRLATGGWFDYLVMGIQPASNTLTLFHTASETGTRYLSAAEVPPTGRSSRITHLVNSFAAPLDAICLTLCMDVLDTAFAPGVSAPAAGGLSTSQVQGLLDVVMGTGKVVGFDLAETAPGLESAQVTSRLASKLMDHVIRHHLKMVNDRTAKIPGGIP